MEDRLANELLDAMNNTGASVKRKEDVHKMQRPIRHLLITDSKGGKSVGWKRISIRENQKHRYYGSH